MSLFGPRVSETSTTTGTGTYSLAGAPAGFQTFVNGIGAGPAFYVALGASGSADEDNWEFGHGTVTSGSPDTLTRTVLASSNSGSAVSWSAGTRTIFNGADPIVLASLLATHKGSSRPAWLPAGGMWLDDSSTPWLLKCWDGSDSITLGSINASTNAFIPYRSGAALGTAATEDVGTSGSTIGKLDGVNSYSATQKFGADSPQIQLLDNGGTLIDFIRQDGTPVDGDDITQMDFTAMQDDGVTLFDYARYLVEQQTVHDGGTAGVARMSWMTVVSGVMAQRLRLANGLQIFNAGAAPTGGDKGAGTLNAAGAVYVNDSILAEVADLVLTEVYDSGEQTITSAGALTLAHGLSARPRIVLGFLVCKTTEANWDVGDEMPWPPVGEYNLTNRSWVHRADATNLNVRFGSGISTSTLYYYDADTGAVVNLTVANFKVRFIAYA